MCRPMEVAVRFAALSLLLLPCAATPTQAKPFPADKGRWEVGFSGRGGSGLGTMGDFTGACAGLDLHVTYFPGHSHLGFRLQWATDQYATTETQVPGGTATTDHSLGYSSLGLVWRAPVGRGQAQYYVLAANSTLDPGSGWADDFYFYYAPARAARPASAGGYFGTAPPFVLPETEQFAVVLGAAWCTPPLSFLFLHRNLSFQTGIEYLQSGTATFYGDPPTVTDANGLVVANPQEATVSSLCFRLAMVLTFPAYPQEEVQAK
jgi:hypothetical protein